MPQATTTLGNLHPPMEVRDSETPSKIKVVTDSSCLSTSEITHVIVCDAAIDLVNVPLIEDISTTTIIEVALQESESANVVELLTATKPLVVAPISTNVPTEEAIMETSSPTFAHVIQVSSNLSPPVVQNAEILVYDGHVTSNIAPSPLDDTSLQENRALSTPESSDT